MRQQAGDIRVVGQAGPFSIGPGMRCHWQPGYRPDATRLAHEMVLDALLQEACGRYGFTPFVHQPEEDVREFELLGTDSPGEFVYRYDRRIATHEQLDDYARRFWWWITERGEEYQRERTA